MSIIIASDIHGSVQGFERLLERAEEDNVDQIILLGDIYYHGPRNPLPDGYDPMRLSVLLNANKDRIRCIKGNCDSEVDQMISEFRFEEDFGFDFAGRHILVTHGHKYDKSNPPPMPGDMLLYGHYHTGFIEEEDGKIYANPGSLSIPKGGTEKSYLLLTPDALILKSLEGKVIRSLQL